MSRSYKQPYTTQQNKGHPPGPGAKREAARAVRQAKDVPSGRAYRKYSCSWNIRDWSFADPKNPRAYRK